MVSINLLHIAFSFLEIKKNDAKTCPSAALYSVPVYLLIPDLTKSGRGVTRIFQRGGGAHCVKHYRHGVFATEYCRLFA